ncbi:VOC family protein [Streptomyces sp. NPDC005438]|uniref:VOC family protein n=1 Tax=Streptomyces sp. NPDC005438 TaxID=3156880 RepID=UPI0033B44262
MAKAAHEYGHHPGTPRWVSLMAHDLPLIQAYYGKLFGWDFRPGSAQLGCQVRGFLGDREVVGLGVRDRGRHPGWMPYLGVPDAHATAGLIQQCGGTVAIGPVTVRGQGRVVIASDPSGAPFGVWQATEHSAPEGEVRRDLVWLELVTWETRTVKHFYQEVFGYEQETDPDDPERLTLRAGGEAVAGVRGLGPHLPGERGAHWTVRFSVEDVDETVRLASDLGGSVLRPPRETGPDRKAVLADPEGSPFSVGLPRV